MLQNNELIKKTDSMEEALGLFVKGQRGRSKSRGYKRDPKASSIFFLLLLQEIRAYQENCMKYKEILKEKAAKILMGLVPVESQIKPGLSKKQMRIHVIS